jgi:hypothetical protein
MNLRFNYKQIAENMHVLKVIFESETSGKRWVLSCMSDIPYINGINIHYIIKSKKFSQTGLTDFRAQTTMFPDAVYNIDEGISTEVWSFLDRKGFNEEIKDAITIKSYIKEILKTTKHCLVSVYTFYTKRRILSLLLSSMITLIVYYVLSYIYPSMIIYSLVPVCSHLAIYFLVNLVIMCRKAHKKITYNIYKGRIHSE